MTYLQFLLIFLVGPSLLLLPLVGGPHLRRAVAAALLAAVLMLVLGAPLARALASNVIEYDADRVGQALAGAPIEAYVAFPLQAFFVGLLTAVAIRRSWWRK